ncbi:mRNA-capping enzyme [Raphidocelis subcapitata]|uniref:mRNA guanylyltransferase n=1 Tax=Raphidocelis subcapitata TaxID=307507 RepID=A0A2V0PGU8_9CHLO|nr:mRNA-capping enzyme [Raphidocelis subcapitata]|eukprot:GBF98986.1 mRNA-capping enzyme [Raphidocelis subcapitata]
MQQNKRQRSDGRPYDPIPKGWRQCPPMGEVSELHPFIPCKVPLGGRLGQTIEEPYQFTPEAACMAAHEKLSAFVQAKQQQTGGAWVPPWAAGRWDPRTRGAFAPQLAMIIDLSNSSRYYNPMEVPQGVTYVKVPCVGRDASPDPLAVNQFCWEVNKALMSYPETYFLIHCTHGFNRTGYMVVSAMMRLLAATGMCVERGVRRFAQQRPPGIYKHEYIEDLFRYHHEVRPAATLTPVVPGWKGPDTPGGDDDDDGGGEGGGEGGQQQKKKEEGHMSHEDKFGEPVPDEEREWLAAQVYDVIVMQDQRAQPGAPPPSNSFAGGAPQFAGSQPVSLDREKLEYVKKKRYWVTWKADGTRYLLLLTHWGAYLIDRACDVRRCQMRFPTALPEERAAAFQRARQKAKRAEEVPLFPVGPGHNWTLMDGEMVVDEIEEGGAKKQRRRYLAYDLMLLNGEGVQDLKFGDRHMLIEREVAAPRGEEARWMCALPAGRAPLVYLYQEEPYGFRRKDFYQLHRGEKLLREFIPRLCHESDGLILQPHDDPYLPRTCDDLLKWKFDYLNSVDFKLEALYGKEPQLLLNYGGGRSRGGAQLNQHRPKEGVRLLVTPGFDPIAYNGRIIECSYNRQERAWEFMRERTDKGTANFIGVFDKVVKSIEDNLQEGDLLAAFEAAYREQPELYEDDIRAQQGLPPLPRRAFQPQPPPQWQQQQQPQWQQPPQHGAPQWQQGPPAHHHHHHPQQQQQYWQPPRGAPPQQQGHAPHHRQQWQGGPPQQQQQQHPYPQQQQHGWQGGGSGGGQPRQQRPRDPSHRLHQQRHPQPPHPAAAEDPADAFGAGDAGDAGDAAFAGDDPADAFGAGDAGDGAFVGDDPAEAGPGLGEDDGHPPFGPGGEEDEEDEEGGGGGYYAATEGGELAPPPLDDE